jgi:hypothetical protein
MEAAFTRLEPRRNNREQLDQTEPEQTKIVPIDCNEEAQALSSTHYRNCRNRDDEVEVDGPERRGEDAADEDGVDGPARPLAGRRAAGIIEPPAVALLRKGTRD